MGHIRYFDGMLRCFSKGFPHILDFVLPVVAQVQQACSGLLFGFGFSWSSWYFSWWICSLQSSWMPTKWRNTKLLMLQLCGNRFWTWSNEDVNTLAVSACVWQMFGIPSGGSNGRTVDMLPFRAVLVMIPTLSCQAAVCWKRESHAWEWDLDAMIWLKAACWCYGFSAEFSVFNDFSMHVSFFFTTIKHQKSRVVQPKPKIYCTGQYHLGGISCDQCHTYAIQTSSSHLGKLLATWWCPQKWRLG